MLAVDYFKHELETRREVKRILRPENRRFY